MDGTGIRLGREYGWTRIWMGREYGWDGSMAGTGITVNKNGSKAPELLNAY
ncbi:MAG: hypothetical protein IKF90_02805 [Parasporobacterium sp.]|nr:hypothetical protein [Parasporobacterium sp.]